MKFLFGIFVLLFFLAPLFGQSASVGGLVKDESGAVVPRAAVTLTGPAATKKVRSQQRGVLRYRSVPG